MALSDAKLRTLKSESKPRKVADRDGLFVLVNPNGSRLWRLNVLFTRAKERMEIFSSMRASDIVPKEGGDRGSRSLKLFLDYAETGRLGEEAKLSDRDPDNDFEDAVIEGLRELNFECVPQVGVANFCRALIDVVRTITPEQLAAYGWRREDLEPAWRTPTILSEAEHADLVASVRAENADAAHAKATPKRAAG